MPSKSYASNTPPSPKKVTVSVKKTGAAFQGIVKSASFIIWASPITGTRERAKSMAADHADIIRSVS